MTSDPFEQLRITEEPRSPDPVFVTGLRNRLVAALTPTDLSPIDLPQRSTTMSEASTVSARTTATSTLQPYLCAEPAAAAIDWYVAVLGASEDLRYTGDDGRVGHAELSIGGATFLLSDPYPELDVPVLPPPALGGTPFSMHLEVPDVDAVHERVVADGRARIGRAPHDEAYGARTFDMVDPFGHRWMIQTPTATPSVAEIEAGMEGFSISRPAAVDDATAPVEIGYVTFGSPDTAVAARFYGALFGWSTEPGNLGEGYAHIENTKLPMGLTPGSAQEAPVIYFRVTDVAASAALVRELGGTVVSEDVYDSGPSAVCLDDQGRTFQLWQPAPGYE
ncbi:MAG: VOC family protein [Ilumatobacteraceae bacterium]